MDEIPIIMLILVVIGFGIINYSTQIFQNSAQAEIFKSITNQTTNADIVAKIQDICSKTPWYILKTDCEYNLYKKFIIPTR